MRLLLATRNAHKLREFERLLPGIQIDILPDSAPTPEETGDTYAENALIKARSAAQATQQPAFADDSRDRGRGTATGARASAPPASRDRTPPTRRTSTSSTTRPPPAAARATCA